MTSTFPSHDETTAPKNIRKTLATIHKSIGFIPNMYAKQAEAPQLFKSYLTISKLFEQTSLTPTEQLIVSMTASFNNDCDFCMSAHSWSAHRQKLDDELIANLRSGTTLKPARYDALRQYTKSIVVNRGKVSQQEITDFLSAGYSHQNALDVIVGVAAKVMTNYTNSIAKTPPNSEFGLENIWPN